MLKAEYRWSLSATPFVDETTRPVRRWIYLAFGAVLCLLLAACLNVAGLLLSRTAARRGEIAIRAALGASPPRLATRLFAESLLLSAAGCAAGLLLAHWFVAAINRWSPIHDAAILPPVYLFAAALGLGCALSSGLVPAVTASRVPILDSIKSSGSPGVTGSRFWHGAIPAAQIAAALTLLTSGTVLTRSFLRLLETPSGLNPARIFCATVQLPGRSPNERHGAFYSELQEAVAALPSVERSTGGVWLPFSSGDNYTPVRIVERPGLKPQPTPLSNAILPRYFETLGIPLEGGRLFSRSDAMGTESVVIVDREFVREYLGGLDPIGLHIESGGVVRRIIGVVGSIKTSALDGPARPFVYLPFLQVPNSSLMLSVRTKPGVQAESITNDVRRALAGLRSDVALFETGTMEERIAESVKVRRLVAGLLDGFAAVGLLLAALGLYGVLSHSVELRRRELAIRTAVGATPGDIVGTVSVSSTRILVAGLIVGVPASLLSARAFQSLLFGVGAADPLSIILAVVLLVAVVAAASALPARRAMSADPLDLLRDR
jgi:predicted permease